MILAFLVVAALVAQGAVQTTGSIIGRVFDADTKAPLSNVRVGMRERSAITDSEGRYILSNVPPGRQLVGIEDGSLTTRPTASQAVTVIAGRNISGIDFHTRLPAQISGRVLDADGNPISGIQVTANRQEYDGYVGSDPQPFRTDELRLSSVGARGLTDDQGRYVISNLRAGLQYWIVASNPKRNPNPISDAPADPQARRPTLAATYYPNASSIEAASPILLHSLEQRDGVDIRMLSVSSYCLEATLTAGGGPGNMRFLLVEDAVSTTRLPSGNFPGSTESPENGRVRLCDLYPGRYHLIAARLEAPPVTAQQSIAAAAVTITNRDVQEFVLAAVPRSKITGELVWDKQPSSRNLSLRVSTYPSPVAGLAALSANGPVSVPGRFSLEVVAGNSYILAIQGLDSHSYIKDITYDGLSILHKPFVPSGADANLKVTIGSDAGSMSAGVADVNGRPTAGSAVFIVPVNSRTEGEVAATFLAGISDENGSYRANGLPPGTYDVFATSDMPPGRMYRDESLLIERTPDAIGKILRARARGKRVSVGPGSDISVPLAPIRLD